MQPPGPSFPPPRPPPWAAGGQRPAWPPAPPPTPLPRPGGDPQGSAILIAVASVLVGVWIVAATVLLQGVGWFAAELIGTIGRSVPPWVWILLALINAAMVAAPAGALWALALHFGRRSVQASARAWTVAGIASGLLGAARTVPVPLNELLLLLTAFVATALAVFVRRLHPASQFLSPSAGPRQRVTGFGIAAGLLALLPWLWAGALGGLTETLLAMAAAAAIGWLAANILDGAWFVTFAGGDQRSNVAGGDQRSNVRKSRPWLVIVGGLTAGVALTPFGAAVGGPGVGLAEMLVLPALGFAAAALHVGAHLHAGADLHAGAPSRAPRLAIAALIAIPAAGPLAFVDPEETSILLGTSDVGWWALVAALLSVPLALAAGVAYGLALSPRRWLAGWIPASLAVLVAVAGVGVYAVAGRPGFYGERLFVILADQADLAGLDGIQDRTTRLRATYERLVAHAENSQVPLREFLDRWDLDYTPYYLVNAVLVEGGPVVRQWLSSRSDVDRVLLDQRLRPLPAAAPTERGAAPAPDGSPLSILEPQWNVTAVGADRVWRELGVTGQGIVIGTSDSGVDGAHPALRDGFRGGDDSWYDPWNATPTPTDHGGHGTHTLGTALGRNGIGVAPGSTWIGCVNLDRNLGSPSRYLDCLQFMLAPFPPGGDPLRDGRPQRAPHVLTNSWGCPEIEGCDSAALLPATAAIRAAGIFFVAAAGNTGPFCGSIDDPPAPYVDTFTVGAVDRNREVAIFSSRGPTADGVVKPDVVAPGVGVLSAMPGGTYGELDGTSMATPHVAGVVALMWSANPRLIGDIATTERILRQTAAPAMPPSLSGETADTCGSVMNIIGAGLVDARAAVQAARRTG